ncbi:glycosyltransferase family 2 protein [Terriglobus sp. TAA 43]|uniref:glycosyltransferase family 2 protein n=1 Tax=Terriglobus sp. TAA 43 TaxID=278961 RepID=UPI000646B737|nr:glycosyltransferase family 2 protein [Terriglobus sp. TAA 43]
MDYSIVIPLLNEEDAISELYTRLKSELEQIASTGKSYEIIFVDDGSRDRTFRLLTELASMDSTVNVIQFRRTYGKTAGLAAGFEMAIGEITITMDGDLQHDPSDLPRFIKRVEEGYDIVCGWREKRVDNLWVRRIPSKIANYFMRKLSRVEIDDFGGGYKAYRTSLLREVPLYGGMQRFIPALASLQGARVCQLAIRNIPRRYGKSRYGIGRVIPVFFDLLRIHFLLNYLQQPLRFFGSWGLALIGSGGIMSVGLIYEWLFRDRHVMLHHGPLMLAAALLIVAGIQCFMGGLIGEMLLWLNKRGQKSDYSIAHMISGHDRETSLTS